MSSLDKLPNWSIFQERPTQDLDELLSPASEIAALLQKYRVDVDTARQQTEAVRSEGQEMLAQQALFAWHLETALKRYEPDFTRTELSKVHRHLRILKDQMRDSLAKAGITWQDPLGWPYDQIVDRAHIEGWLHQPQFTAEVVAEVLEPIICCDGKAIRQGRVIMGAPPPNTTPSAEVAVQNSGTPVAATLSTSNERTVD